MLRMAIAYTARRGSVGGRPHAISNSLRTIGVLAGTAVLIDFRDAQVGTTRLFVDLVLYKNHAHHHADNNVCTLLFDWLRSPSSVRFLLELAGVDEELLVPLAWRAPGRVVGDGDENEPRLVTDMLV